MAPGRGPRPHRVHADGTAAERCHRPCQTQRRFQPKEEDGTVRGHLMLLTDDGRHLRMSSQSLWVPEDGGVSSIW